MPASLFYNLSDDKKQKIIAVGISEFSRYGYTDSSTNRIVKNSGISKGSLFKYFENKEDLYFYLLDCVTGAFASSLKDNMETFSGDLFERVIQYSEREFSWYIQNPEAYRLIMNAFTKSDTDIYRKTEARFHNKGRDIYYNLLEDIDTDQLRWDKQKTLDVLRWFLQGFNEDFISRTEVQGESGPGLDRIRDEYVTCLTGYMEILKSGFIQ